MRLSIPTVAPFSFDQTLAFVRRFPPGRVETIVADDRHTAAIALGGRAHAFTLCGGNGLAVEVADDISPELQRELARRAAWFVGAQDDLRPLYAAATDDPPFRALIDSLYGLHHVRFLGLEHIAVYCVLMQRTPVAVAARFHARLLARIGLPVNVGDHTLRAMPELAALAALDEGILADGLGHRAKATRIAGVVRGVAAIGEEFLRTAPYCEARAALLAVPGLGPFSATAILLRGLGRGDAAAFVAQPARPREGLALAMFEREGRAIYGAAWDERAIARRYGDQLGTWSFYLKTGAARLTGSGTRAGSSRS
jgi:DNA-3-methyladenine glycosylase II